MATQVTVPAPVITAQAMARHVRMSPQKARLVIDLIRGHRAEDALHILQFTKKRAAHDIQKVLRSAIANAERKDEDAGASLDIDQLYVSSCCVNEGSRWKRLRPAPMGRAFRYQRRTAHIVVAVAEHHTAASERHAAAAAAAQSEKGVRGAVKKARKALTGNEGKGRGSKPKAKS
jgi:large subunit ribosomal protein L22